MSGAKAAAAASDGTAAASDSQASEPTSGTDKKAGAETAADDATAQRHRSALAEISARLANELAAELSRARPSAAAIRECCQDALAKRLAVEAADRLLLEVPLFREQDRPRVWQVLLGCLGKDEALWDSWTRKLDLSDQHIVKSDCARTR